VLVDRSQAVAAKGALMDKGRSLQAWVWVVAVLGYLILPIVGFYVSLGVGLEGALGGTPSRGEQAAGGVAGIGMFVFPVLAWLINLALHHERRAYGEQAVDGVVLNWIGGLLVAAVVVIIANLYALPRVNEYLERREQEDVADGAGLSEGEPQPSSEPTLYSGPQVAAEFAAKAMAMLRSDSYEVSTITDATDSARMAAAVEANAPDVSTVQFLPFTYDATVIAHDGTPSSLRGGRVNLRVTVQLDEGTGDVRGGLEDTWTAANHVSCRGMRIHALDGISDMQEIACATADAVDDLPVVTEPLREEADVLQTMADLRTSIDSDDARRTVREELQLLGEDDVEAAREGDALVLAVSMPATCVVAVREDGRQPLLFKGYRGQQVRSGCTTDPYSNTLATN
jgi:hypothetical protein